MNDAACMLSEFELAGTKVTLRGRSALPTSRPWARLLIVHGYGEHGGRYVHFMQWLAARGVACEAIDLRGHGRSGGRRGYVRQWDEYLDDLQALLDRRFQSNADPSPPRFLMGHSHGGLIVSAGGERGILAKAGVVGCIIASPYFATRVPVPRAKRLLAHAANHIVPWLRVQKGVKPEWLTSDPAMRAEDRADQLINRVATPRWFLTMRVAQRRVMSEAPSFTMPLLCITGDADIVADPSAVIEFYRRAKSKDKSLYVYENRAHELIREVGKEKVFLDIAQWMRTRVGQSMIVPAAEQ